MKKISLYYSPLVQGLTFYTRNPKRRMALVVGMIPWQDYVTDWVLEETHIQIQRHFNQYYFQLCLKPFLHLVNPVIYIWGYKAPSFFIEYIRDNQFDVFFLEDGFIRSGPDDDSASPPLSIVMDSQAPYFDTTQPNDLTDLLANFDFNQSGYEEKLAQELYDYYLSHRVSKYNHQHYVDIAPIYGPKDKQRILILGQVPHDDSLKYGGGEGISLLDVVNKARVENPTAQIIIKPHPMTLDDAEVIAALHKMCCLVLTQPLHLVDALDTIDHVYTITSLGGFEALIRGKKVTVLGQPFYSNWCNNIAKLNLHNDKNLAKANTASLTELFYICYYTYQLHYVEDNMSNQRASTISVLKDLK
ncbi:MAG: hypothetical protein Q4P13_07990 [Psychrobacter sp.]|nr:hypothetical protein [Psychrobacter sp.]